MSEPLLYLDGRVSVHAGDCLDVVKTLADNSIDACVTDPPYALTSIVKRFGPAANGHVSTEPKVGATGAYARAAKGFMGKAWDNGSTAFSVDFWAEVWRVLKPGAHVVAFGGTRSYHRLACAIEDAGFECRDAVMWHYGTGFPKSHSVSKALDQLERNKWLDVAKSIDDFDINHILRAWKEHSRTANGAGVIFPRSETETGMSTPKSDFALASVLLSLNHGSSLATAIIAELRSNEAPPTCGDSPRSAQSNAASYITGSSVLVSIVGLSRASLEAIRSPISIAQSSARITLGESTSHLDKAVEVLMIWLGSGRSSQRENIDAFCAALTDALKLITLSQSESFQNCDTSDQMECASATTVIITESTAALLISFMAATAKLAAVDNAAQLLSPRGKRFNAAGEGRSNGGDIFRSDHPDYQPYDSATIEARDWEGWGTALKPATEIIFVGRKPLSEPTVAANVLRWRTGAINIDACRVEAPDGITPGGAQGRMPQPEDWDSSSRIMRSVPHAEGRWPANLCHDGSAEVLAAFPDVGGSPPVGSMGGGSNKHSIYGDFAGERHSNGFGDSGSAARFFYSAKADRDDRLGSKHPTVKPVDLMQWLCRLVMPKGGTILDPFAGTGTTGAAAWREGFNAVLIEREPEYLADISRRMKLEMCGPDERARESVKARNAGKPVDHGPLFGGTEIQRSRRAALRYRLSKCSPDQMELI